MISIFDPDDFAARPYVAMLNQIGHVVAGAAVASFSPVQFWGALAFGSAILAWELWQLRRRGARKSDYFADLFFWLTGFGGWFSAIEFGHVTGPAVYSPAYVICLGAAWFVIMKGRARE